MGLAAEAAPAGDRQKELQTGLVGDARRIEIVEPAGGPTFLDRSHGEPAVGVHREDAEFEPVRAFERMRPDHETRFRRPASAASASLLSATKRSSAVWMKLVM